jgi:metal-responsive CopG/Arc/MetJ family transcriptional regulator
MEASKKIQVTLKPHVIAILEGYAKEKGISKSAVISLALEKFVREEKANENGK